MRHKPVGYTAGKTLDMRYITQIFQKDNRNIFTDDSYLAQDILKYYFEIKDTNVKSFKLRQLQRWLVQNNKEIKMHYVDRGHLRHTTIGNRIHGFERRINRNFNDLVQMNLIKQEFLVPADKLKDKDVGLYSFTKLGEFLALIIKSMNLKDEKKDLTAIQTKKEEREANNESLYIVIVSMLAVGENAPYQATLIKTFLTKLQSNKLFSNFVDYLVLVCNSNNDIDGIHSLIMIYCLNYILNQAPERNIFLDLWYESGNELDPDGRNIFLYERKLGIEEYFISNSKGYSREYEKQRFDNRGDYNKIVLEGECVNCKKSSVIILSHDVYRTLIRRVSDSFDTKVGNIKKFACKYCQSEGSVVLSTF